MVKKILMSAMVMLLLFTAGCDENNNLSPDNNKQPKQTTENQNSQKTENETEVDAEKDKSVAEKDKNSGRQKKTLQVKIYYPDDAGMSLIPVSRQILIEKDADKYFAVCKLLTENPKEKNLTKIFPAHAKINGATFKRDTVFVNFDGSVTEHFVGGSTGEEMLINSFVNSLTEFPEVKQVKFLINGRDVETLSGHMDLSVPIKREM